MLLDITGMRVYLRVGVTDMRKAINTLSILVQDSMNLDPFSRGLYVFCNRRRDILKILYWDRNGFCLWQKRLEKHRFRWPESEKEVLEIETLKLGWLLSGLDITRAHEKLNYTSVL
jgi:transposase